MLLKSVLFLSFYTSWTRSSECPNSSTELKARLFEDLLDLQNNKDSFTVGEPTYRGNEVIFKSYMANVPRNAFITYDSNHIRRIDLSGKKIRHVERDAFYGLNCLIGIDLSGNRITKITEGVFGGLRNLQALDLTDNRLDDLPDGVFAQMVRLKTLSLAKNQLTVLRTEAFHDLKALEVLDSSENSIEKIESGSFEHFTNLRVLQLGSNKIEDLGAESWDNMGSLRLLNVSGNVLESFDMSMKYSFYRSLNELYLDDNQLTKLFLANLRRRFPVLNVLGINDNLWSCQDLAVIVQSLKNANVDHPGVADVQPNIEKIACDRPKIVVSPQPSPTTTTTTTSTYAEFNLNDDDEEPSEESHVANPLVALIAIIAITIIFYLSYTCFKYQAYYGIIRIFRRPRLYTESENIRLIGNGYQYQST